MQLPYTSKYYILIYQYNISECKIYRNLQYLNIKRNCHTHLNISNSITQYYGSGTTETHQWARDKSPVQSVKKLNIIS